jgi:3-oxoacyl-[acyl-carrier protein] reductase
MKAAILAGRTAIITGASRGIGLGITRALAKNGVSCILVGRSAQTLEAQIAQLPSGNHIAFVGDVASADSWTKFEAENV